MPKYLDGIGACADEEQAAESTVVAAKPEKKKKNHLPLHQIMKEHYEPWGGGGFYDDERGSSRDPVASRSFSCIDLRRCVSRNFDDERGSSRDPVASRSFSCIDFGRCVSRNFDDERGSSRVSDVSRGVDGVPEPRTAVNTEVCETQTTVSSKEDEEEAPLSQKQLLSKLLSEIDPYRIAASLAQTAEAFPDPNCPELLLARFLDCLGSLLSGVSFQWGDIFKEPVWSKLFHDVIDLSHIPEPFYNITVEWINDHLPFDMLLKFVAWTFDYIIQSVWSECLEEGERVSPLSNVSILVAAVLVLRSHPHVLSWRLRDQRSSQLWYERKGALTTPLAVWMIAQASQDDLPLGLKLWAFTLLPLFVHTNLQSKDLILEFVENISKKPDVRTKLLNASAWVPAPSFEILLRLTFPAREKATTRRFVDIYPFLKDVALAGVPEHLRVNEQIFTFCLRLAKEGNPELAKEATEIAIWCLTKHVDCWEHWEYLCNTENLETSVALLKRLVEKWEDHSLQLSLLSSYDVLALSKRWLKKNKIKKVSTSDEEAIQEVKIQQEAMEQEVNIFTQKMFTFSLRLAGKGNPVLAKEATEIAIWSLTLNVVWWKVWENLYKENLEASVVILKKLVEQWKDHSLKLSSWLLNHTLARAPHSKAMILQVTQKIFTQKIFTFSLRLAGRGNPDLAKEAIEMAIWSLMENVNCWKHWEYLYKKNLETSFALLKKLVEKWKDRSLKPSSSSSRRNTIEKIFTLSLRLAIEGNPDLAKEAIEMAIWSLMENVDCWKHWECLYKKNLETSFALLKKLVEKWKDRSLKPSSSSSSSSPSDTIEKIYTLSLRLAEEGNHVLAKEATKIAIWSLAEKDDLYEKNRKAVVALLKKPIDKWNEHSLKLLPSRSDTLLLSRTMKRFRLKNKKVITEGGANDSLFKEAYTTWKVIWRRLYLGSSSLKGTWIAALVLVFAVAAGTILSISRGNY